MTKKAQGTLIIIGGHERDGDQEILHEVVKRANRKGNKQIVVVTVASQDPNPQAKEYKAIFRELGAEGVEVLDIRERADALDEERLKVLKDEPVIFFTGGDQLRITSQIGDSPLYQLMHEHYVDGGIIAGTSAGAAAMSETMLIYGEADSSSEISAIGMAPGLGLIEGMVIDTHFAERGRIGRLLGAVAQNPRNLGLGIDEDTAVLVKHDHFQVKGSGAVYVLDGSQITYSSLSEDNPEGVISIFGVIVHVLGDGDRFDLMTWQPATTESEEKQPSIEKEDN